MVAVPPVPAPATAPPVAPAIENSPLTNDVAAEDVHEAHADSTSPEQTHEEVVSQTAVGEKAEHEEETAQQPVEEEPVEEEVEERGPIEEIPVVDEPPKMNWYILK